AGPMLPLAFFRDRTFSAASLVGLLINIAFYGLIFDLSLYFQQIRGYTPADDRVGVCADDRDRAGGQYLRRPGSGSDRRTAPMVAGQAILAIGCFFLLVAISVNTPYRDLWWQMVMLGAGIGLTVPPMTSALLATVDRSQSGVASGVLNTTRQVGSVIGVALFGSLIANRDHFVTGVHLALYASIALLVIGIVAALAAVREPA
ncbi:MAG: MFS transporter, partial [Pseudomonadota bacterium]|nr:MFS transporter [Pseudomonadota bacterium]